MFGKNWWLAGLLAAVNLVAAETPLIEAAKNSDVTAAKALLQKKSTNPSEAAPDGATALHWAVNRNNLELVDVLLRAGADPKATNRYGVQPISLAAENGNAAIIARLLKSGADPNAGLPGGETALMTAARVGNVDAIKALLVAGAKVDWRDETRGETALMWAAAHNNVNAIRMLLEFGADKSVATNHPPPPLTGKEPPDFGGFRQFKSPTPTGFTAFMFAVRAGHIEAVKALLDAGANVNDLLSDGESTLIVACANAHWQLADLLLDKGADPNLAGAGWNALHQAIRERRPNIGFGIPGPMPSGTLDSIEVVKKMIAKGVNVNARMTKNGMKDGQRNRLNRLGATAFLLAAKNTDVEAMKVLAAAGADANIPTADMTTPLMVASGLYIWNPGEDGGSLVGQEEEVLEAVKMCIAMGNKVTDTNIYKETALHGIAYRGANIVAQFLIDSGANLDARDIRGWTPLLIANGISYSEFYKAQLGTAELLRKEMQKRGITTEGQVADGKECLDCLQTRIDQQHAANERDEKMEAEFNAAVGVQGNPQGK